MNIKGKEVEKWKGCHVEASGVENDHHVFKPSIFESESVDLISIDEGQVFCADALLQVLDSNSPMLQGK